MICKKYVYTYIPQFSCTKFYPKLPPWCSQQSPGVSLAQSALSAMGIPTTAKTSLAAVDNAAMGQWWSDGFMKCFNAGVLWCYMMQVTINGLIAFALVLGWVIGDSA